MKIERSRNRAGSKHGSDENARPETTSEHVLDFLGQWLERNHSTLPQPCPLDVRDCATWWITRMQEKQYDMERNRDYQVRLRQSLSVFLGLTLGARRLVVAGISDGVPWRGEPVHVYKMVYDETMRMRQEDTAKYRRSTIEKAALKLGVRLQEVSHV